MASKVSWLRLQLLGWCLGWPRASEAPGICILAPLHGALRWAPLGGEALGGPSKHAFCGFIQSKALGTWLLSLTVLSSLSPSAGYKGAPGSAGGRCGRGPPSPHRGEPTHTRAATTLSCQIRHPRGPGICRRVRKVSFYASLGLLTAPCPLSIWQKERLRPEWGKQLAQGHSVSWCQNWDYGPISWWVRTGL